MHLSARMAFGEAVTRAPGVRTQPLPAALGTNRCIVQLSSGECVSRIQLLLMQRRTHIEQHVQALVIHWQIPSFEYRVFQTCCPNNSTARPVAASARKSHHLGWHLPLSGVGICPSFFIRQSVSALVNFGNSSCCTAPWLMLNRSLQV